MSTTIELPTPHNGGQLDVFQHPARFQVVICGRRWGKTQLGQLIISIAALQGKTAWWVAPTYEMAGNLWRSLKLLLSPVIVSANGSSKLMQLATGGQIKIWSASTADTMRGGAPHVVVIDEAAMIPDGDIWHAVIRPTLVDNRGRTYFLSTPRGRNWLWHLYQRGLDDLNGEYKSWRFPTISNPTIPHLADEIEEAHATLPERLFQQEFLAEFIDEGGGVFRKILDVAVVDRKIPYRGDFVMGVDWGRHNDYTVISTFDRNARQQVDLDRFNKISWDAQRGAVVKMIKKWKPSLIIAEANSIGEPNIEQLQREGYPVTPFWTTGHSKRNLIENYAGAIERGELKLMNDRVQIAEHQAFEMSRTPSGNFKYSAPDGAHDDTVIANALAWHGCHNSVSWSDFKFLQV